MVKYINENKNETLYSISIVRKTNNFGVFAHKLKLLENFYEEYSVLYSYVDLMISKKGYYSKNISYPNFNIYWNKSNQNNNKKYSITLLKKDDYYNKEFLKNSDYKELKLLLDNFIDNILVQGYLADSVMNTRSIYIDKFKNNNYVKIGFKNTNIYNSLQLSKYDIGKRIYDELVRKMLNNFLVFLKSDFEIDGVNILVEGNTKDFSDDKNRTILIKYNFIMPKNEIIKYKNLDITGQDLLDSSYILIDNERIFSKC